MKIFNQKEIKGQRILCWFSCGAASALATKITLDLFSSTNSVVPVYCDLARNEHPDNRRFMGDCEKWFGVKIERIKNPHYKMIEQVFGVQGWRNGAHGKGGYMSGIAGAVCTGQMKKQPRFAFQKPDDFHVFGLTKEEGKRIANFEENNPELNLIWILHQQGKGKRDCFDALRKAGIELPEMYKLGYRNNNCLGCVKATSPGYWQKVRQDFPEVFARRAKQSRMIGCKLVRVDGERIFLDQLDPLRNFKFKNEDISCGVQCGGSV